MDLVKKIAENKVELTEVAVHARKLLYNNRQQKIRNMSLPRSTRTVSISYELNPPLGSPDAGNLSTSKNQEFEVNGAPVDGQKKYYEVLKEAIADARNTVGNELTAWRDVVGKLELSKETKKTFKCEEGDEADDDDEAEENEQA